MSKVIHVHIYEPHKPSIFGKSKKSDKSQLHIYTCEHCDECSAYKDNKCINVGNVFGAKCPVGRVNKSNGFTQRANGYYDQIRKWKEEYSDEYHKLESAPKRITKVFGGWMLPYTFLAMNERIPFKGHEGLFNGGCPFLSDDDFNKENLSLMISFKPRALMGGIITDYQNKHMPKMIKDLYDFYPDKFKSIASDLEVALKIVKSYDYVGRKAYLKTVAPSLVKVKKNDFWDWDGEKISKKDKKFMSFEPIDWDECYASFTPKDSAVIEITSNDQVTSDTRFAD